MKLKMWVSMSAVCGLVMFGCGDDDPPSQEPLPEQPVLSIFPPIIGLPVVAADVSAAAVGAASVTNTGQNALQLSNIRVTGPDAGLFSVVTPDDGALTVESRATELIRVEFSPSARGVYRARLELDANASNLSSAALELVGPAVATKSGVEFPDIAPIDDPVRPFEGQSFGTVGVYNLGRASLILTSYAITGDSFELAPGVVVPGASCAAQGEAACNGDPADPTDDRDLFCFVADPADPDDDVCAVSIPGEDFLSIQVDAVGSGNATLTVTSNDPDSPSLDIQLQN